MRSLEAWEETAAQALAWDSEELIARLNDSPAPERTRRFPDTASLAQLANRCVEVDPWRATLMAEAHVTGARRRPVSDLRRAVAKRSVTLHRETDPIALDAATSVLVTEPNGARREALVHAYDGEMGALKGPARAVIDALRGALGALDGRLVRSLALSDADGDDVLHATDDLLRELDLWVCRGLGIDRARLTWADRTRSLFGRSLLAALPSATWVSLGVRPFERLGLDLALRGVVDELHPARGVTHGLCVRVVSPGQRAVLAGRPMLSGLGVTDVMGAVSVASISCMAKGVFPGVRRGCDRAVDGVAHALGRRLLLERRFLQREACVDAVPRERVMLEAAHGELLRLRFEVAMARFVEHVFARGPEPGARFHDELMRAWGASPSPTWAPWVAAQCFEATGFWAGAHGAKARGARVEPIVVEELRARFDEDWFRNPKAGAGLAMIFDEMRAVGVDAWCEARGGAASAGRTSARVEECVREARRVG